MPCNSDYMHPTPKEEQSVMLMNLLYEVGLITKKPGAYGEISMLDTHCKMLCEFCQKNDVKKYSLELQIWWRDHQYADSERVKMEIASKKEDEERREALSKLTDYEKSLLGLD